MSVCLSVYPHECVPWRALVYLSVFFWESVIKMNLVFLSIYMTDHMSVCLSVCPFKLIYIFLSVNNLLVKEPVHLSLSLFVHFSICPFVSFSICPLVHYFSDSINVVRINCTVRLLYYKGPHWWEIIISLLLSFCLSVFL